MNNNTIIYKILNLSEKNFDRVKFWIMLIKELINI
jgi:hypothetical protein